MLTKIKRELQIIHLTVTNDALADGRITRPEKKILSSFKEMIRDLNDILNVLAETHGIDPSPHDRDGYLRLLDELFQFLLSHLFEVAKDEEGNVETTAANLLEVIANKLDTLLNKLIKSY